MSEVGGDGGTQQHFEDSFKETSEMEMNSRISWHQGEDG